VCRSAELPFEGKNVVVYSLGGFAQDINRGADDDGGGNRGVGGINRGADGGDHRGVGGNEPPCPKVLAEDNRRVDGEDNEDDEADGGVIHNSNADANGNGRGNEEEEGVGWGLCRRLAAVSLGGGKKQALGGAAAVAAGGVYEGDGCECCVPDRRSRGGPFVLPIGQKKPVRKFAPVVPDRPMKQVSQTQ